MWQAEIKIGENEIAFELMGFNVAMVACNITTSNEEEEEAFKRMSKEVQGPRLLHHHCRQFCGGFRIQEEGAGNRSSRKPTGSP